MKIDRFFIQGAGSSVRLTIRQSKLELELSNVLAFIDDFPTQECGCPVPCLIARVYIIYIYILYI